MSSITNPTELVNEFKKSGEFDRLRRELLRQFQTSDELNDFKSRIEDILQRVTKDGKLRSILSNDALYGELMQETERYPVVERAAAGVSMLSDPAFVSGIGESLQAILRQTTDLQPMPKSLPGENSEKAERSNVAMSSESPEVARLLQTSERPSESAAIPIHVSSPDQLLGNTLPPETKQEPQKTVTSTLITLSSVTDTHVGGEPADRSADVNMEDGTGPSLT